MSVANARWRTEAGRLNATHIIGELGESIANVYHTDTLQGQANARLIAAAPQLAEALQKLTRRVAMWKRGVAEGIEVLAVAEEAESALEAARGRG